MFWEVLDPISGMLYSLVFVSLVVLPILSIRQRIKVAELQKTNTGPKRVSEAIPFCSQLKNNHVCLVLVFWFFRPP